MKEPRKTRKQSGTTDMHSVRIHRSFVITPGVNFLA